MSEASSEITIINLATKYCKQELTFKTIFRRPCKLSHISIRDLGSTDNRCPEHIAPGAGASLNLSHVYGQDVDM